MIRTLRMTPAYSGPTPTANPGQVSGIIGATHERQWQDNPGRGVRKPNRRTRVPRRLAYANLHSKYGSGRHSAIGLDLSAAGSEILQELYRQRF
jgi:hypothetical protein